MATRRGLFAAMEDMDEDNVVVLTPGADAEDEIKMRDAVDESDESADRIGEITGTIDNSINWVDSLMKIGDDLADSAEKGVGIDEISIQPTMLAVEALCHKLGIDGVKIFPATESFGSTQSNITATRIAAEGIKETGNKVWEAILKALKYAREKIVAFGRMIMDMITKLIRPNVAKMKKRVEGMKEAGNAEAFQDASLFRAFGKPGESKVTVAEVVKLTTVPKTLEEMPAKDWEKVDGDSTISGLINDTSVHATKGSFEVKSGWEGKKVPEDGKIDCGSKTALMSILNNLEGADKALTEIDREIKADIDKVASLVKSMAKTEEDKKKVQEMIKDINTANKAVTAIFRIYKDTVVAGFKYVKKCVEIHEKGSKEKTD